MNARAPWIVLGFLALFVGWTGCATPPPAAKPELRLQTGRYGSAVVAAAQDVHRALGGFAGDDTI